MIKLVMAIVSSDDSKNVLEKLSEQGFSVTVASSMGGYLRNVNTTIFCGVEEAMVEVVLSIIRKSCSEPSQSIQSRPTAKTGLATSVSAPPKAESQATIFVLDVDHFEQV